MSQRYYHLLVIVLIVFAYVAAFMQFQSQIAFMRLPPEWHGQFYLLLIISFIFTVILPFCKRNPFIWLLLIFQSVLCIVISLPMGGYLGVELTLSTALIIEAFEYTTIWGGIGFSSGLIGIMLGVEYLPITAWGVNLPTPPAPFGIYGLMVIVFNIVIRYQRDNQIPAAEIRQMYQATIVQLSQVNLQLQEYAATVEQETLINERKRLAREIHDTLAYTLTNLVMMLEAAKFLSKQSSNDIGEHLERARLQASDGLMEVHRALQALRPVQMNEASGLSAIQRLVGAFTKATQLEVSLDLGNAPLNFGEEADLVIYRLVQEGITNALRHGHATRIAITFSVVENRVHIQIKDNGIGSDGVKEGYGLSGMRERIERLGGKLEISGSSGHGFRLLATIPI
ncbi:MAG: sensor histidine kinase [Bacteroidota bacterium]